jgi:hypothetical protein
MVTIAALASSDTSRKCLSRPLSGSWPMNTPGLASGTLF